ncbi:MAG: replication-associated recombination protein A, partial [Bacteroidales bacterium]|nr:replication-associated recombination protein A [Bacteroidales bacterium]
VLTDKIVADIIQQNIATYDRDGENHYDLISAFINSMRGSDPNAAVYYLGRMLAGGEDPKFIARRMLILASEDIGNANPNALLLANACFDTVHKIGYPECRITLSQTAIYLACSPKSNASYMAIDIALEKIKQTGDLPVPLQIRNAPTSLMKDLGYGQNYRYAHDYDGNFADMEFLPAGLEGFRFYAPGDNAKERDMRQRLRQLWQEKYGY